ncbi:MAG: hypothetical protein ABW321_10475 [Polyangiales bacterium]
MAGLLLTAAFASGARAQMRGVPLTSDQFNVDLVTGPIVGPNRVVSLGGAYTALGYGIDNAIITPAAYAARTLWDTRWFEFDITVDYSPGALRRIDFINNGRTNVANSDFLFVSLGTTLIAGNLGVGGIIRAQNYRIGDYADFTLLLANYGMCYSFMDGQLLVGAAVRTAALALTSLQDGGTLGTFTKSGPEVGVILGLADRPYRVGVALRSAVEARADKAPMSELRFTPPNAVVLPAELQLGLAYQFGDRPLNMRWINPHERERELRNTILLRRLRRQREQRERELAEQTGGRVSSRHYEWLEEPRDPTFWREEGVRIAIEDAELQRVAALAARRHEASLRALSRKYLLVSADLLFIGTTPRGIGLESFLSQVRQDSGRYPSLTFRVGAEGEPIPNRLRLRIGSYLEPSRFDRVRPRLHGTVGTDMRLFAFDMFGLVSEFDVRVTATLDIAERYSNFGVSVGIWH